MNANSQQTTLLGNKFNTFQISKKYLNWDVLSDDFIHKLQLLNVSLDDEKTSLLLFANNPKNYPNETFKFSHEKIVTFFRILIKTSKLNSLIFLNNIILYILSDILAPGKYHKDFSKIFQSKNTKKIFELFV